MTAAIEGLRVLVVEDEFLVAMLLQEMLETAGCVVAGPIPRLAEALEAAASEACDVAVLDINLGGERIDPVAVILDGRKIPFVFVTGYAADSLPDAFAARPRLPKPFKSADLVATLAEAVAPAPARVPHRA